MRRKVAHALAAVTIVLTRAGGSNAFTATRPLPSGACSPACRQASARRSSPSGDVPDLVGQNDFVTAIDVLKKDMGLDIIPEDQRPLYAIGKLVAPLPLELASGIRFADCETLTLISQLKQSVADATGLMSLDTLVAVRAGSAGDGGYEGDTKNRGIGETAEAYTAAIKYAMEHNLKEIELEVNRLVPLREVQEAA